MSNYSSVLKRIENAVICYPDNKALVFKDNSYTYKELSRLTGRIAGELSRIGAGSGAVVSVLVPRSEYRTIAPVGVLRSGAAYQPLDASHPVDRISFMMEDASSAALVTSHCYDELIGRIDIPSGTQIIYIEDIASLPDAEEPFWPEVSEDDAFVLLYTSGSTGVPKGIILTCGNLASYVNWYIDYYETDENSHVAQHPSFAFDLHVGETILPLCSGSTVYIIPEEIRTDLFALNEFFEANSITHVTMTTQLGRSFVNNITNHSLRHLTVGGEALVSVRKPEGYRLHNGYGPAECTLFVTMFEVDRDYKEKVPIGGPMTDVEVYLMGSDGEQVSTGQTGEICIAGAHVARGYVKRPELTEKVFTPNPFSDKSGYERIYHTGDLASYDERGLLEFMGRADRQIKIRGFRIEPAELEALLREFDGIDDVVVNDAMHAGSKVLVAYYLSKEPLDEKKLKDYVLSKKPSYMLPSYFIHITKIPLNTNGKVDRKALPGIPGSDHRADYIAPETDTQKTVAGFYEEILECENIGLEDDFIICGGNSLSAATLLYKIRSHFGCAIGIRDIMENTTVRSLAARIDGAGSSDKDELVPVPLEASEEYIPGSAQERIFTAQSLLSDSDPTYHLKISIGAEGGFDKKRAEDAIASLIRAHESMRTSFHLTDEGLRMSIFPASDELIEDAVRDTETKGEVRFALDKAPLFAWQYEDKEITFFWHHIISDGRSNILFAREFIDAYNGKTIEPKELHQKEFADLEIRRRGSAAFEEQRGAWREILEPFADSEALSLITDNAGQTSGEKKAEHIRFTLPEDVSSMIDEYCGRHSITPYTFLITAFSVLLSKVSGQENIMVGTVMDGRSVPGMEDIFGMYVNTLPVCASVKSDIGLKELMEQMSDTVLMAMESQAVSLEEIAADFATMGGSERTAHGHLLFDVLFVMQSFDRNLPDIDTGAVSLEFYSDERAMYDITLETEKREDGYHFDFEYDTGLYNAGSIEVIAEHLRTLILSCLDAHGAAVGELSIISDSEREKLLKDFQGETFTYTDDTVVDRLGRCVSDDPDKIAVRFGGETLSYSKLWEKSDKLAKRLLSLTRDGGDKTPERRIALFADRSPDMITAIWGILRAGYSYVPVSPAYPTERICYILSDCDASGIICSEASLPEEAALLLKEKSAFVLELDKDEDDNEASDISLPIIGSERAAYMIYTSGTTGKPKGVVIEHAQLAHLLEVYTDIYGLDSSDTVLQFAEYVFDQSVWDIFHILTVGGTLLLLPGELVRDPEKLTDYATEHKVTVASLTPAFLRLLDPSEWKSLRVLDVGGEAPERSLLCAWAEGRTVFNTYGPTETTVNATSFKLSDMGVLSTCLTEKENVPIGRAVPGTQVYILSGNELCGIGVPGELCIAGGQLARGYFRREELNAEKFVPNPFGEGRMYRSGDIARYLPNGNIEYISRMDDQVKIRGYRIELGEIENVIRSVEGISDAAVLIKTDARGEKQICGYYVPGDGCAYGQEEMRSVLSERLPVYMVPAYLVEMESLPLTINGKLNKRALPEPGMSGTEEFVAAASTEEEDIAAAYKEVLKLDKISVTADFLSMGGDSIKAIRIVSILRKAGYDVDGATLLKSRTIRALASGIKLTSAITYEEWKEVIPTPIMKMYAKAGMPKPYHYNQSAMFEMGQPVSAKVICRAMDALRECHGVLRAVAAADGLEIKERVSSFEMPVYDGLSEEERYNKINELQSTMSPEEGEMIKAALFINEDIRSLFLSFHHLVIDEVSWDIIREDLTRLIKAALKGDNELLAAKEDIKKSSTISFGEWSKRLWDYGSSDASLSERKYWEKVHKSLDRKPLSYFEKRKKGSGFEYIYENVDAGISAKLKEVCSKRYSLGVDRAILAALAMALSRAKGSSFTQILLESHGRADIGKDIHCERTVGWFTSVYPVIIPYYPKDDDQIGAAAQALISVPNYGIGYGLMYDDLEELGGVIFNYLGEERSGSEDELLRYCDDVSLSEIAPENGDPGTISFNIRMSDSGLTIECCYDNKFSKSKVEELLFEFKNCIINIAFKDANEHIKGLWEVCIGGDMPFSDWSMMQRRFPADNIEAVGRLTSLQQGMIFRYVSEPGTSAYFLQDKLRLKGRWDKDKFEAALRLVVMRHDALRIRFLYEGYSEVWQVFLKNADYEISYTDKSFDEACAVDIERGMDLFNEVPWRVTVCNSSSEEEPKEILLSMHHSIVDGWSFSVCIEDLMGYYKRLLEGESEEDIAYSIRRSFDIQSSFADYLRAGLGSNVERSLENWGRYLDGVYEGTTLTSFEDYCEDKVVFEKRSLEISGDKAERIRAYNRTHGVTSSSFFGVIWGLALGFESGESDIVFGETVSGRSVDLPGVDRIAGMLIRTIPVRVRWKGSSRVLSLIRERADAYLDMQPYEDASLGDIQARYARGDMLVKCLYVYENYPEPDYSGYEIEDVHEEVDYDLTISVEESGGFLISLLYDRSMYPEKYIDLLLARIENLALQVISDSDIAVCDLQRITDIEKAYILGSISGHKKEYPDKTVLHMIEDAVNEAPDRTALILDDRKLTYGEMWKAATALSHEIGFGPERFAAIMADKSFEMIISMLAVMMSGGAYVSIDPGYPADRISYILDDCKPDTILCYTAKSDAIGSFVSESDIRLIDTSLDELLGRDETAEQPWHEADLMNRLAYMIYTSGTTGNPKGVQIEHCSLSDFIYANIDSFGSWRDDVVLYMANAVFDASIQQIYPALSVGGAVALITRDHMGTAGEIADYCQMVGATVIGATNALVRTFERDDFKDIRTISIGGDEADRDVFEMWNRYGCTVINDYGPTEVTVHALSHRFEGNEGERIPLGRPYYNKNVYLLSDGCLCGMGQKGEIVIGGRGLARGYLNKDEITARAFVSDPINGGRMYHSGDHGRMDPNYEILYEGRSDSQIKIRGFRIELGEIENVLKEYEGIGDVACVCRRDKGKEPYLAAYVTANMQLDTEDIHSFLSERLPAYMVPGFIIQITELPLNYSGKLDEKALPDPRPVRKSNGRLPENSYEQFVCEQFCRILGLDIVGRDDSFFDLGGSSIDIMKLISALGSKDIRISDVFLNPTPQKLARLLRDDLRNMQGSQSEYVILRRGDVDSPSMFCLPASGGLSGCYIELIKDLKFDGNIYGLSDNKYSIFGKMSLEEMESFDPDEKDMWDDTIKSYLGHISALFKDGDYFAGYSQGGTLAHVIADRLEKDGHKVGGVVMLEAEPFYKEDLESLVDEVRISRVARAAAVFFGSSFVKENDIIQKSNATGLREQLKYMLSIHGESDDDLMLHAFFETYLVYAVNTAFPLLTKGRIDARINSVVLSMDKKTKDIFLRESDPWMDFTKDQGKCYGIYGSDDDHLIFLSKYKQLILKAWDIFMRY